MKIYLVYPEEGSVPEYFTNRQKASRFMAELKKVGAEPYQEERELVSYLRWQDEFGSKWVDLASKLLSKVEDFFGEEDFPDFYEEAGEVINQIK
jgi:hypothetical protein